jgi:hypothetical protein
MRSGHSTTRHLALLAEKVNRNFEKEAILQCWVRELGGWRFLLSGCLLYRTEMLATTEVKWDFLEHWRGCDVIPRFAIANSQEALGKMDGYSKFKQSYQHGDQRKMNYNHVTKVTAIKHWCIPILGQDSSVCVTNRYRLDGLGIESLWGGLFRTRPDRPWGPPSLLYNEYWVCPGVKRPGCVVDHPPPSSAEVKEIVELPVLHLWAFVACDRVNLTFTIPILAVRDVGVCERFFS